jgi:hypothetical protein
VALNNHPGKSFKDGTSSLRAGDNMGPPRRRIESEPEHFPPVLELE